MADLNYEQQALIGRGAYGTVFRAVDHQNNRIVALKRVRLKQNYEEGIPTSTLREIALLKQLDNARHPNIIRLFDVFHSATPEFHRRESYLNLVFEHVDHDLAKFLEKYPPPGLPDHLIKSIMYQLLDAVDFLHTNLVIHRDLKPQNILVARSGRIKIADFGLARIYSFCVAITSVVVTLWYRSPEVLLQTKYATPLDVWSLGCIFAELYNRNALFPGQSDVDQLHKIFIVIGTPTEEDWPVDVSLPLTTFQGYNGLGWKTVVPDICDDGADLLKGLLEFNPSRRICAREALLHSYFNEVRCDETDDQGPQGSTTDSTLALRTPVPAAQRSPVPLTTRSSMSPTTRAPMSWPGRSGSSDPKISPKYNLLMSVDSNHNERTIRSPDDVSR